MKVISVVGGRPQFIKAAVVSHVLRRRHTEVLVHSGQHYDYNMSQQFFEELDIPHPDYNLGVSGGTHAQMTGRIMMAMEEVLLKEKPDWVLVYGDMNTTLAAALAAVKVQVPVCHVEAGARVGSRENPEEINRICTDHIATLLLASTASALPWLEKENLLSRSVFAGDPMYDAFLEYGDKCRPEELELTDLKSRETVRAPQSFYYLTCHRQENTGTDEPLREILCAMEQLDAPAVYPVHPRNKERALRLQELYGFKNTLLVEPVGYLESLCLVKNARKIVTDSGGLQREAFFAQKKCVTVWDWVGCPETFVDGRNVLSKPNAAEILSHLAEPQTIRTDCAPFGDGHAAEKIVAAMENCTISCE